MIVRTASYRVYPGEVERCLEAIREFVTAVADEPGTLAYEAYRLEDGVSFLHFMRFSDADAEARHRTTPHVKTFVERLYPRCEQPPVFDALEPVASARRFSEADVLHGAGEGL